VGRKTAERIRLELRDKLAKGTSELIAGGAPRANGQDIIADAVTALQNLGYQRIVAERTVGQVLRTFAPAQTPALKELVRDALRALGQEKGE
jgi:Holliday junction resolvasome RuvABC DNA-binding subunit